MNNGPRVMIVEDEALVALHLQARLRGLGYDVCGIAASCIEALDLARETEPDLVLMDIRLQGDTDGIGTATRLAKHCSAPVVYLSAHSEDATLERARTTRPYGYLLKPFSERELHATLQMALERRRLDVEVARSEERLRLALEAADMGLWDLDPISGNVQLGDRAGSTFGIGTDSGQATRDELVACIDIEDRARAEADLSACNERSSRCESEVRMWRSSGETRWIRTQAKRDDRGHVIGVVRDITLQKESELALHDQKNELARLVGARTAELESTVGELDAFSHSVAHDLRSPVRAIVGLSQILREEAAAELPSEFKDSLERVHTAGLQMSRMIDALLELSHLRQLELRAQPVDIGTLAEELVLELRRRDPQRDVEFVCTRGIQVPMDPDLARIALWNLLENAWKFTSKRARARIEIGSIPAEDSCVLFVRDNGAGFEAAYADRLFRAFERLHDADDFEGTGIGLTTVSRIVKRHNGRVWAVGELDKGATFFIAVPPMTLVPA